jgi:hypothetical protein
MVDKLSILEDSLCDAVVEALGTRAAEPEAFSEKFKQLFELVREDCEKASLAEYKAKAPSILAELRDAAQGFEKRSFERWQPSFDHIEMMWEVARELGEMHGQAIEANGGEDKNSVMAALAHLFPRALLVAQEVICLLRGGFPDGALARWRSLHELTVTAMYIAKHGETVAVPYLLSFHFAARRAARQMNEHSERANIAGFSDDDMKEFDARCEGAETILGRSIDKDHLGEWPAITQKHTTFADIELDVGMDHWRPRYKWASTHTHAHHRPIDKLLGMAEADRQAHLVGASNSGFVDPFQMTAISLAQIAVTYLLHAANPDRVVHSNVLLKLADEMSGISIENERATRAAFDAQKAT